MSVYIGRESFDGNESFQLEHLTRRLNLRDCKSALEYVRSDVRLLQDVSVLEIVALWISRMKRKFQLLFQFLFRRK